VNVLASSLLSYVAADSSLVQFGTREVRLAYLRFPRSDRFDR
jgi:hypothetical protein